MKPLDEDDESERGELVPGFVALEIPLLDGDEGVVQGYTPFSLVSIPSYGYRLAYS